MRAAGRLKTDAAYLNNDKGGWTSRPPAEAAGKPSTMVNAIQTQNLNGGGNLPNRTVHLVL